MTTRKKKARAMRRKTGPHRKAKDGLPQPLREPNPDEQSLRRACETYWGSQMRPMARDMAVDRQTLRSWVVCRVKTDYSILERVAEAASRVAGKEITVELIRTPEEGGICYGGRWILPGHPEFAFLNRVISTALPDPDAMDE